MLDLELEDRSKNKKPRTAFFVVALTTLVFQQCAVLECNLDQPIQPICGAMSPESWGKEKWAEQLKQAMVVVCTADVLLEGLRHSFVKMSEINLLVFDEAHHAKKNHAFAR